MGRREIIIRILENRLFSIKQKIKNKKKDEGFFCFMVSEDSTHGKLAPLLLNT